MSTRTATETPRIDIPENHPSSYFLSRVFMRLVSDYRFEGRENLPTGQPFVITTNHLSYFDAPASLAGINQTYPSAAAKKLQGTTIGHLVKFFIGVVWIEQSAPDRQALRQFLAILKANRGVALAAEGTRSKTGVLQKGQSGAAFVARKANVPIVPWAMAGTEKIFREVRPKVTVRIGKPYHLPEERVSLEEDTTRIMCAIAALLPEAYHGFYQGHPMIEEMRSIVC